MNRYLLAGLAVVCIGAEASENPFDLKSNLQNLDADQSALLTQLRKSEKGDEFLEDEPVKEEAKKSEQSTPISVQESNLSDVAITKPETQENTLDTMSTEENKTSPAKVEVTVDVPQETRVKEENNMTMQPETGADIQEEANQSDAVQQSNAEAVPAVKEELTQDASPQQNDMNLTKESQTKEDDIEKLYLEAIKEVEGK